MKIVVLSSGGLDSSVMIARFLENDHDVYPIHINYGQLAEHKEWDACQRVCDKFSLIPKKMDIPGFGELPSGITNSEFDVYDDAFLPTRNLTLLVLAAAYAYTKDADVVAVGFLSANQFPDQTQEFLDKAEDCISTSLGTKMRLLAPLIELEKKDVLKLAKKYDLISITYYCHSGTDPPCGKCISCKERQNAENSV
jgi:7-cyano-7-deazaguanine synthase